MNLIELFDLIRAISLDKVLKTVKPRLQGVDKQDRKDAYSAIRKVAVYFEHQLKTSLLKEQTAIDTSWRYGADKTYNKTYISLSGQQFNHSDRNDLSEHLNRLFIEKKSQRIAVLLGDPGAGKTTFAKHWLSECYLRWKENPLNNPLPLLITLKDIQDLRNILNEVLCFPKGIDLTGAEQRALQAQQPLIIFLDGYDEIADKLNLYQVNNWEDWQYAKFIVSTRPEKFGYLENTIQLQQQLIDLFSPMETSGKIAACNQLFLIKLLPLSDEEIRAYMVEWIRHAPSEITEANWSIEQYWQALIVIPGLKELATNPLILSLVLVNLPNLHAEYQSKSEAERLHLTQINIYDRFIDKWFENANPTMLDTLNRKHPDIKLPIGFKSKEYLKLYMQNLAYQCLLDGVGGKFSVEILAENTLMFYLLDDPRGKQDEFIRKLSDEQKRAFIIVLRSGCLLECDGQYFKFFHKSLVEHFTRRHLSNDELARIDSYFIILAKNLNEALFRAEPNLLKLLGEQANKEKHFAQGLFQILAYSKGHDGFKIAASNAIMILHRAGFSLNQEPLFPGVIDNLVDVRIPGADLSGAMLHRVNFAGADLSNVNLQGAYCVEANFTEANLSGIIWGETPDVFFSYNITALTFVWGYPLLVVGDEQGNIHFVNTETRAVEDSKSAGIFIWDRTSYSITALAVNGSPLAEQVCGKSSDLLAVGMRNGYVYIWSLPTHKRLTYQKLPTEAGISQFVTVLCWASSNNYLGIGTEGGQIFLYRWENEKLNILTAYHLNSVVLLIRERESSAQTENLEWLLGDSQGLYLWIPKKNQCNTLSTEPHLFPKTDRERVCFSASWNGEEVLIGNWYEIYYYNVSSGVWKKLDLNIHSIFESIDFLQDNHFICLTSNNLSNVLYEVNIDTLSVQAIDRQKQGYNLHAVNDFLFVSVSHQSNSLFFQNMNKLRLDSREKAGGEIQPIVALLYFPEYQELFVNTQEGKISFYSLQPNSQLKKYELFEPDQIRIRKLEQIRSQVLRRQLKQKLLLEQEKSSENRFLEGDLKYDINLVQMIELKLELRLGLDKKFNSVQELEIKLNNAYDCRQMYRREKFGEESERILGLKDQERREEHKKSLCFQLEYLQARSRELSEKERVSKEYSEKFIEAEEKATISDIANRLGNNWDKINCYRYFQSQSLLAVGLTDGYLGLLFLENKDPPIYIKNGQNPISCLTFNGNQIVVADEENVIRIWNTSTQKCLYTFNVPGFPIFDLSFIINRFGRLLLSAGFKEYQFQSLAWKYHELDNQYRIIDVFGTPLQSSWYGMNITEVQQVSRTQYQRLQQQHVIGEPNTFYTHIDNPKEIEQERRELHDLELLLERLRYVREDAEKLMPSVFFHDKDVGFNYWRIYLVRISKAKIVAEQKTSGLISKSEADITVHVYGVAEGLDQLGRRVFIRFDLVNDNNNESYSRIKNKQIVSTDTTEAAAKIAFMSLFEDSKARLELEKIVCHYAGELSFEQLDRRLLASVMIDQKKQYGDLKDRILYKILGGRETLVAEDRNGHNCLTWLREKLRPFDHLHIPRKAWDWLAVSPKSILSASGATFFSKDCMLKCIDVHDWKKSTVTIAVSYSS